VETSESSVFNPVTRVRPVESVSGSWMASKTPNAKFGLFFTNYWTSTTTVQLIATRCIISRLRRIVLVSVVVPLADDVITSKRTFYDRVTDYVTLI
jgi:hypothetical protein